MIDLILVRVWFPLLLRAFALNLRFFGSMCAIEWWHRLTVFGLPVATGKEVSTIGIRWRSDLFWLRHTGSPKTVNRCHPVSAFLLCSVILGGIAIGQDNPISNETATESKAGAHPPADPDKKPDIEHPAASKLDIKKMKKLTAGLAAISGIAIFGIGGIAITMLWARRLRRLARDLGPPQKTAGNDFWFLKPPKPTVAESEIAESHRPPHSPPTSESQE